MCHPGGLCLLESQLCADEMPQKLWLRLDGIGDAIEDVDAEDVGDVYDYVLMSLPLFRVISVTRTILGGNHFHTEGRQTHTERRH